MRNLSATNPQSAHPRKLFAFLLVIPIFSGVVTWALSEGASNSTALIENYLAIFGLSLSATSIILIPVPYIFQWDWRAKYFGAAAFSLVSASTLGFVPVLCIVIYGVWEPEIRVLFLALYLALVASWCRRFITVYQAAYNDQKLWRKLYVEETDAVYFMQRAEKTVMDEKFNFSYFPPIWATAVTMCFAMALVPFMDSMKDFVGVPFAHIFMAIAGLPFTLALIGLATRSYLVYYFFPRKIMNTRGKEVYVDMTSGPV